MKKDFRRVVVVKGDYKGRVGKADFPMLIRQVM